MSDAKPAMTFEFINLDGGAGVPKDKAVRKRIRKQAMQKAALARKEKGNWGKRNLLQYPVFEQGRQQAGSSAVIEPVNFPTALVLAPPPTSGYDRIRIEYDFDILDLSALTSMHVGRMAAAFIAEDPARVPSMLKQRGWSYLSHIPSRFGHVECLDDAVRCVAARAHQLLSTPHEAADPKSVRPLYQKAIRSLGKAISNPEINTQPEVLCAAQMLALHELLAYEGQDQSAWIHHASGASSLIKHRGTNRYKSRFERDLLVAHAGTTHTEALFSARNSFLATDTWQSVLNSASDEQGAGYSDSSIALMELWAIIVPVPNLFCNTESIVLNTPHFSPASATSPCSSDDEDNISLDSLPGVDNTLFRLHTVRRALLSWRERHSTALEDAISTLPDPESADYEDEAACAASLERPFEALSVCLVHLLITQRLIVALDPQNGAALERLSQHFASQLMGLHDMALRISPTSSLYLRVKAAVGKSIQDTSDDWKKAAGKFTSGIIDKKIFVRWCRLKGRPMAEDF